MVACPDGARMDPHEWVSRQLASGGGSVPSLLQVEPSHAKFEEVVDISLTELSLVEVEVQFNFLLSTIDMQLLSQRWQRRVTGHIRPEFGALGDAQSPLNAHAVLQLRLPAGNHKIRLNHETTGWMVAERFLTGPLPSTVCFPLRLLARHAPWPGSYDEKQRTVLVSPSLSVPASAGSDVVVAAAMPAGGSVPLPRLGGIAPTGATNYAGGVFGVWDHDAIKSMVGDGKARAVDGGQGFWVLPLTFGGTARGEVVVTLDSRTQRPWSGGSWPASFPPDRWKMEAAAASLTHPAHTDHTIFGLPIGAPMLEQPAAGSVEFGGAPSTHVDSSIQSSVVGLPPGPVSAFSSGVLGASPPPPALPESGSNTLWWIALLVLFLVVTRKLDVWPQELERKFDATASQCVDTARGVVLQPRAGGEAKELPSIVEVTQWAARNRREPAARGLRYDSSYGSL